MLELGRDLGELLHAAAVLPRSPGAERVSATIALFPIAPDASDATG